MIFSYLCGNLLNNICCTGIWANTKPNFHNIIAASHSFIYAKVFLIFVSFFSVRFGVAFLSVIKITRCVFWAPFKLHTIIYLFAL